MIDAKRLAKLLHDNRCHSQPWSTCTDHVKVWMPYAKRVLAADDPVAELHSVVCDAEIDTTFVVKGGCPERDRHIAWLRDRDFLEQGDGLFEVSA